MKKLLLSAILISNMGAMASSNTLECGLFDKVAQGKPNVSIKVNLDSNDIFESKPNNENTASITVEGTDFVKLTVSRAGSYDSTILNRKMVNALGEGESFGLASNGGQSDEMTVVCYKGKAPF